MIAPETEPAPRAVFWTPETSRVCEDLDEVVATHDPRSVAGCLDRLRERVSAGLVAAGFIAYEAAPGLDPVLTAHSAGGDPVLWFGLFRRMYTTPTADLTAPGSGYAVGEWAPCVERAAYLRTVARIRALIAAGDTYQTNYTFPMLADFRGDPYAWFLDLCDLQQADHAAFLELGRHAVVSASPELFFQLDGDRVVTRPMKGTRPRGLLLADDEAMRDALASSTKDQAENVMIVDLLRNDLGRISEVGSVRVTDLYAVERYETVWQMTSTVEARTHAEVPEILRALFPCGSVTGAPKRRTMEVIREVEPHQRGVYCGAVGWWAPDRRAAFCVAIRTAWIDRTAGRARYHVGGGITWDSTPEGEYDECLTKAALLRRRRPAFSLLESLRLESGQYWLLDAHLDRMRASATYFGYPWDAAVIHAALEGSACAYPVGTYKARLLLERTGRVTVACTPIEAASTRVRLGLAKAPVDAGDVFLYHKTTCRHTYEEALAGRPDCDDVLLWNQHGELTESTRANVVVEIGGAWCTPPVRSGLLGGTFRRALLDRGEAQERTLRVEDLAHSPRIRLVNSVRGWLDTEWVGPATSPSAT